MAAIASNRDIMEIIKNASEQIPMYIQTVTIVAQSIESLNTINIKSLQKGASNAQRLTIVIDSYITALDEMLLKLDFVNTVDTGLTSKLNSLTGKGGLIGDEKSGIIGMVTSFSALSDNILSVGKKTLKMKFFGKIIASGVKTIISVAASIVEQIEKSGLAKKEIDATWAININKILDALKSICTTLLSLALLIPLAIIAGAAVMLGMIVFSMIIMGITAFIALIGMIDISNVIESVDNLLSVLKSIEKIVLHLILLALLIPLGILAGAIVLVGLIFLSIVLITISLILWGLGTLLDSMQLPKLIGEIVKALLLLNVVILLLLLTAALMILLQLVAGAVKFSIIWTFLGQLAILLVVLLVVGLALSAAGTYLAPVAAAMIIAVGAIALVVGLILLIAVFLWLLQNIYIDKKAIEKNVQKIMETIYMILETIFNSAFEAGGGQKSDSWFEQILSFMGGAVKQLLSAIMAVFLLAITLVAIGLILFIAVELRILQEIDLAQDKITENVNLVISTAFMVIDSIFGSPVTPEQDTPEGWFESVLKWAGGTFLTIIKAILAVLFLALTLISITLVLFIATELRVLQMLDLKPDKVRENVTLVIDTAFLVIDSIFGSPEHPEEDTPEGWFESIFKWVGGTFLTIIKAIMAVYFLALTLISITLILFIASELKAIQNMYLDQKTIEQNIQIVIDTAQLVVDSLFDRKDDKPSDPSSKGFFITLLEFFSQPLADIFTALMAIAFLVLIVIAIALILFIATELQTLQEMILDPTMITMNVQTVIDTAQMVVNTLFDPSDDKEDKPSNKGFFLTILEFLCKPLADIFTAIMAIGFLALIVVAIALIINIAKQLQEIEKIQLNAATVKKKTSDVINAAKHVINAVIQPDDSKPKAAKGIFRKILRMVLPSSLLDMIDAMMAIGFLALAKSAVGLVGEIATNLTAIAKLPSMNGINGKVDQVISGARSVINKIINNGGGISRKDAEELSYIGGRIERMIGIMRTLGNLAKATNSVTQVDKGRAQQTQKSIDLVLGLLDSVAKNSKSDINVTRAKLNQLDYLQRIIRRFNDINDVDIKNSEAVLKNYSAFLDKIGSSNLEGIKTTTNLFAKMAELSKSINGDFQGLADTLNDKIAPLLEELKKVMEDVQVKIEQVGSDVSSSVYASSQDSLTSSEMAAQTSREMPNATPEQKSLFTQKRMDQQAQRQSNDLASKLDELIDMFRNGEAYVRRHY